MKNQKQKAIAQVTRAVVNGGLFAGCLSFSFVAYADINFQFVYKDAPGTGFLDPVNGSGRQVALNTAATEFSRMFGSHFTNSGTIVLEATATHSPQGDTLASAGSEYVDRGVAGFNLDEVVREKLQTGIDPNGSKPDGSLDINFGNNWELGFNAPVSSERYDFYSTMFHEFTHTLGFSSSIGQFGDPLLGTRDAGSWSAFDSHIVDKNGTPVIDPTTFAINETVWDAGSVGGPSPAGGLFFDGPNARAANGGNPVGLYTPSPWEEGSSVSHLDDNNSAYAGMMMLAASDTGPYARDYSAVEIGILHDIGYTVTAVPEPEAYAMMLAGLGLLGWVTRRKKRHDQ
ncbi:PEP-CTERM sorting domain-containing protein [Nitrosospira multiformis]|uniref:PEP-CTERM protein-sorting domain-containing protein n=1 Tax=Nitrosospira multiformis TaxID=1231 RepID=A0A1I7HB29_9PROT|nr:PEP-CTERM sorting domain-containing protein [Nitrosospira multiformis]SFU57924.1 PEP-CTERM protein-sorting domain-containing protein [Nitrosospira multiformis]